MNHQLITSILLVQIIRIILLDTLITIQQLRVQEEEAEDSEVADPQEIAVLRVASNKRAEEEASITVNLELMKESQQLVEEEEGLTGHHLEKLMKTLVENNDSLEEEEVEVQPSRNLLKVEGKDHAIDLCTTE